MEHCIGPVERSVSELAEEHGHAASSLKETPQLCGAASLRRSVSAASVRSIGGLPGAAGAQPKAAAKAPAARQRPGRSGKIGD